MDQNKATCARRIPVRIQGRKGGAPARAQNEPMLLAQGLAHLVDLVYQPTNGRGDMVEPHHAKALPQQLRDRREAGAGQSRSTLEQCHGWTRTFYVISHPPSIIRSPRHMLSSLITLEISSECIDKHKERL